MYHFGSFLFLTVLLISACSNIPLSTMVKMSTFDNDDFLAVQADLVRVKAVLTQGFIVDLSNTTLVLQVKSTDATEKYFFPLRQRSTNQIQRSLVEQVFSLSKKGIDDFRKAQQRASQGGLLEYSYHMKILFQIIDPNVKSGSASVALKLAKDDDYIAIVDDLVLKAGMKRDF